MSLGYTAHSIQDSNHKQIGGTQKKKKIYIYICIYIYISQKDILNFKQKTMSIYLNLSMSQCLSLFLNNMKLIYKWALFKFRFTWTEKYSILNIMFI